MAFVITTINEWRLQVFWWLFSFIASKLSLGINNWERLFCYTREKLFAVVLRNKCSKIFLKATVKTSVSRYFFNKLTDLESTIFLKKQLRHRYFLEKFAKLLRMPILQNTFWRRLLYTKIIIFFYINMIYTWNINEQKKDINQASEY